MYDLQHFLYTSISFAITAVILVVVYKKLHTPAQKDAVLKISAIATVILHYSSLWVDFFTTGTAEMQESMLLPIYPCNVAMWLLLITAFCKRKLGKAFQMLAEITFYLGLIGGVVGIVINENYANTPSLADWDILKGLLSHSTMLLGCIYVLVGQYIRIRVYNLFAVVIGLLGLIVDGYIIIGLYRLAKLDPPNCMFLLENPFPQITWFNPYILGVFAVILVFITTALVEQLTLKKEERWYSVLQSKMQRKTKEKEERI